MITIRIAKDKDARRISYLIQKNTELVKENKHTDAQIKAWKKENTPAKIKAKLKDRILFCAFLKRQLVGTIGLKGNEVVGLYINPYKRGYGIGKKLLNHLEKFALTQGQTHLELSATPSGYGFYKKYGYQEKGPVLVVINNVEFDETKMEKQLI